MGVLNDARKAFKALNGLICVYKPSGVPVRQVQHRIVSALCRDLNEMPRPPQEQRVKISGATNAPMKVELVPNLADDPLVAGPRYLSEDFRCSYATHLGLFTSGVLLVGINDGTRLTYLINSARLTRAYKIQGRLGKSTDTFFSNGKVIELATYKHVTRGKIDKIIGHMQAAHTKQMYESSGVHMDSQALYDMASRGPLRPANNKLPVIYGIRCVDFESPNFTLEVQAINETEKYMFSLVHELGLQLKTAAHCTAMQCIRQGKFTTEHALLRRQWELQYILSNIEICDQILSENERLLKPLSANLM